MNTNNNLNNNLNFIAAHRIEVEKSQDYATWREIDDAGELCDHCSTLRSCAGDTCSFRQKLIASGVYDV